MIVWQNFVYSECLNHDIGSFSTEGYGLLQQKVGLKRNKKENFGLTLILLLAENCHTSRINIVLLIEHATLLFQSSITRYIRCLSIMSSIITTR